MVMHVFLILYISLNLCKVKLFDKIKLGHSFPAIYKIHIWLLIPLFLVNFVIDSYQIKKHCSVEPVFDASFSSMILDGRIFQPEIWFV